MIKISANKGGKSKRVVNVTMNNNTRSGTKSNGTSISSLISITDESGSNRRPLTQVKPVSALVSTIAAALVQAYFTLNNNLHAPNNAVVMSAPSVSVVSIKKVKYDFYVKVINSDKKKEFNIYVLRD